MYSMHQLPLLSLNTYATLLHAEIFSYLTFSLFQIYDIDFVIYIFLAYIAAIGKKFTAQ